MVIVCLIWWYTCIPTVLDVWQVKNSYLTINTHTCSSNGLPWSITEKTWSGFEHTLTRAGAWWAISSCTVELTELFIGLENQTQIIRCPNYLQHVNCTVTNTIILFITTCYVLLFPSIYCCTLAYLQHKKCDKSTILLDNQQRLCLVLAINANSAGLKICLKYLNIVLYLSLILFILQNPLYLSYILASYTIFCKEMLSYLSWCWVWQLSP